MTRRRIHALRVLAAAAMAAMAIAPAALAARSPASSRSCAVDAEPPTEMQPVPLAGAPDAAVLGSYAVLRRAQMPSDELPMLAQFAPQLGLARYYPEEIRRIATVAGGRSVYLIPGFPPLARVPPARCLPAAERGARRQLLERAAARAAEPNYVIVSVLARRGETELEGTRRRFVDVALGGGPLSGAFATKPTLDLVPDGVAAVRVHRAIGEPSTAPVSENAYDTTPPAALRARVQALLKAPLASIRHLLSLRHPSAAQRRRLLRDYAHSLVRSIQLLRPREVEWLDGEGRVLRSFVPRAGTGPAYSFIFGEGSSA